MSNKNRLTSFLMVTILTLGIIINSISPAFAWISGGTGGSVNGTPGSGLGFPNTSTHQVRSYVLSLVGCNQSNGVFKEETVLGSALVDGNRNVDAGNTPLEQTWTYFVYDIKNKSYRPATKLDFIFGDRQVVLRPAGQSLPDVLPKGTLKELTIYPTSNYEQVIQYYTGRKPGEIPEPGYDENKQGKASELVEKVLNSKAFIYAPGFEKDDIVGFFKNGDLAIHVEPMFQETKPNQVTLTGSQLEYYASEDTTKNGGTKRYNGRYYTNAPWITTGVVNSAHLLPHEQGKSISNLSVNIQGYEKSKHIKEATSKYVNQFMNDNGKQRLKNASGIYIIKLMPDNKSIKHPTEINIPPTDFQLMKLEPVPIKDVGMIDFEKGMIKLNI